MAASTTIEWTEMTWNPVTGCTKVSQGCKHCYAERMAKRLQGMGVEQYRNGFSVTLAPQVLNQPLRWRKPRLIFVNSMSDLFHEKVPLGYVEKVFEVMHSTPWHTYQVLTKRSARLKELSSRLRWTSNIWMGVSVENEETKFRIADLRKTHAHVKFLSLEPLIGPIDNLDLRSIDWVIVGGESGPKARPIRKEWVEAIRQRCAANSVPFFFKQWGKAKFNVDPTDPTIHTAHPMHAKGGCQIDGRVYRDMPTPRPTRHYFGNRGKTANSDIVSKPASGTSG